MPADTRFGVFEIGMNHAGEIAPLAKLVRPHVAIVTTVEPVHLDHFGSVEAIADAKAEIFAGLAAGGVAIINRDNPHYERLRAHAAAAGVRVVTFGWHDDADVRIEAAQMRADGRPCRSSPPARPHAFTYTLGAPGAHIAQNSLAVVAALQRDRRRCRRVPLAALAGMRPRRRAAAPARF